MSQFHSKGQNICEVLQQRGLPMVVDATSRPFFPIVPPRDGGWAGQGFVKRILQTGGARKVRTVNISQKLLLEHVFKVLAQKFHGDNYSVIC